MTVYNAIENGFEFKVIPSEYANKLYDVYHGNTFILSFGEKGNRHYKDKFGYYKDLDHLDKTKRKSFMSANKLKEDYYDITKPLYWIKTYLY